MTFLDTFLDDCRDAVRTGQEETLGVVRSALEDPQAFAAAVLDRPKPWFFLADDDLTVFCTSARPGSASAPHDHATWSVLGCFLGCEESWHHRRTDDGLADVGTGVLRAGDAHGLPADAVHSVMNRWDAPNGVVHVYRGNFLALDRTIWDPVTLTAHPAGMAEMVAPSPGEAPTSGSPGGVPMTTDDGPSLGGTLFAALAADDVAATTDWLQAVFGFQTLTEHTDTCAVDDEFRYLIGPVSMIVVGVHRRRSDRPDGLDHLALRVPGRDELQRWHDQLRRGGHEPGPITDWNFGTFTEVRGPDDLPIRLFVPALG